MGPPLQGGRPHSPICRGGQHPPRRGQAPALRVSARRSCVGARSARPPAPAGAGGPDPSLQRVHRRRRVKDAAPYRGTGRASVCRGGQHPPAGAGHRPVPYDPAGDWGVLPSSMGLYIMTAWFSTRNSSASSLPSRSNTLRKMALCRVKPPQYSPRISCSFSYTS